MNRLEKRAAIIGADNIHILNVCGDLHASNTGSGEIFAPTVIENMIAFLRCCIDTWEPTIYQPAKKYDDAVLALVKATIAETNLIARS